MIYVYSVFLFFLLFFFIKSIHNIILNFIYKIFQIYFLEVYKNDNFDLKYILYDEELVGLILKIFLYIQNGFILSFEPTMRKNLKNLFWISKI